MRNLIICIDKTLDYKYPELAQKWHLDNKKLANEIVSTLDTKGLLS